MCRANEKRAAKEKLHLIHVELGVEAAIEYATAAGIEVDFDTYMSNFIMPEESWSVVTLRWLKELLTDGKPQPIEAIRTLAILNRILPGEDDEDYQKTWANFKALASENGLSGGKRGFWQLPKL